MRLAIKKLGVLALHRASRLVGAGGEGFLVLTYHRVSREPDPADPLKISLATFDRQIAHLKRRHAALSGAEFADAVLRRRPLPRAACLVTFDDGWEDNHANAFDVLQRHRLPATVFVSTDYVGTRREFWHERVRKFVMGATPGVGASPAGLPDEAARGIAAVLRRPARERLEGLERLFEYLKSLPPGELDRVGDLLGATGDAPHAQGPPAMLSWEQVREMHQAGIAIGSHGRTHAILTRLDGPGITEELQGSRDAIAQMLGEPPLLLAYPNGDYDGRVLEAAAAAGFVAGFTCLPGRNRSVERPLELRRINVREDSSQGPTGGFSGACFEAELSGLRQGLRSRAAPRRR